MASITTKDVKRLANEYAHCYAFVGDDTIPLKQAELFAAIDELEKVGRVMTVEIRAAWSEEEITKVVEKSIANAGLGESCIVPRRLLQACLNRMISDFVWINDEFGCSKDTVESLIEDGDLEEIRDLRKVLGIKAG